MRENKRPRDKPWRIGSFTKNFSWGRPKDGLVRLYDAINTGFDGNLKPVPRAVFWERLETKGYIPHIPANFFVFNGVLDGENYILPDELIFSALKTDHRIQFDRLALFTLLLSEVGSWKGARSGQKQPSEWARYFFLEKISRLEKVENNEYSANKIEKYLVSDRRFLGGSGTRKLSTNLAYFLSQANVENISSDTDLSWISDCIFLALDRYYMLDQPENMSIDWAINTLAENDVATLSGSFEEVVLENENVLARLYTEGRGLDRLASPIDTTVIGVISRQPTIYKILPQIVGNWLSSRLYIEFVNERDLESISSFNALKFYTDAIEKLHNSISKPELSGDQLIALVRPENDRN